MIGRCYLLGNLKLVQAEVKLSLYISQIDLLYPFHIEPTVKPVIESSSVEGRNTLYVNWNLPSEDNVATGFLVRLYDSAKVLIHQENISSITVLSAKIPNLKFNKDYSLEVLTYHCTRLGPPSDLYNVKINSKGEMCSSGSGKDGWMPSTAL